MKEGWQDFKPTAQRVYHYIVGTFSLCGSLGFYKEEVSADDPAKRDPKDCKACLKKLEKRIAAKVSS